MAERNTAKSKRGDPVKAGPKAGHGGDLASENARLEAELAAARVKIAELEQKHEEIVNRIDWVIDSLHNLES